MNRTSRLTTSLGVIVLAGAAALAACSREDEGDDAGLGCADDKQYFESEVWTKVLVGKTCIGCHNADGPAQNTRMVLSSDPADLEKNFETVRAFAKGEGKALLAQKPSGAAGSHGGGTLFAPDSPEAQILAGFVERQSGRCTTLTESSVSLNQRQIRRLTRDEYGNTLRDLLNVEGGYAAALPADTVADGFDNQAGALQTGTLFVDKLRTNAEAIAKAVEIARVASCTPAQGQEASCAESSIRSFGARAFRRPLTDAEVTRYRGVYDLASSGDGFDGGIRAVVETMLQSPGFLYRTELGTKGTDGFDRLTPWEIASELSYLFWKSMPDQKLFDLAASGDLSKPEVVLEQAARLLEDPRGKQAMARFVEQWLDLERLPQSVKDEATYPGFDEALRKDLREETVAFFDHVARSPEGSLQELLTATYTYPVGKAAAYYGITAGEGGRAATQAGRAGILTHASVLAVQATPGSASPVRRGKLVREKFFCQAIAPPPPGVSAQLAPIAEGTPNRERFTQHSADPACASCHKLMDPVGFGFEGFDGVGKMVQGADVSGEIVATASTNGAFDGVVDLQDKLAKSVDVQDCFARLWIRYAYGIKESDASLALASSMAQTFAGSGTRMRTLLTSLITSDQIFRRVTDADDGVASVPPPSSDPSTPPPATGTPDASTPPPSGTSPGVTADVETVQQGDAYQKNVTVTNTGTTAVEWKVKLAKQGTIFNAWNTDYTEQADGWLFVGKDYNRRLEPGQSTTFGFQAR